MAVVAIVGAGLLWWSLAQLPLPKPAANRPSAGVSPATRQGQGKLALQGLKSLYEQMQSAGARLVPPVGTELANAVAGGDRGTILRAFGDTIESRYNQREEAIQAFCSLS